MSSDAPSTTSSGSAAASQWQPKTMAERIRRLLLNRSQVQLSADQAAMQSISRNLRREDDLAEEWRRRNLGLLYGDQPAPPQEQDVGDSYFGDVVSEIHNHPARGMGTFAKLAAAGMLAAAIPGGALLWNLPEILTALKPVPQASNGDPGNYTDTTLDVGLSGGTLVLPRPNP